MESNAPKTFYKEPKFIAGAAIGLLAGAYLLFSGGVRDKIVSLAKGVTPFPREHTQNKLVTQGRAFVKKYSGCGDLWNYVLEEIGAPASWVNRDSKKLGMKWGIGMNITKPYAAAKKAGAWIQYQKGLFPKPGDLVLIGEYPHEMEHVFVVLSVKDNVMETAEYGAANNAGRRGTRVVVNGRIDNDTLGKRKLIGWIDADKIPRT